MGWLFYWQFNIWSESSIFHLKIYLFDFLLNTYFTIRLLFTKCQLQITSFSVHFYIIKFNFRNFMKISNVYSLPLLQWLSVKFTHSSIHFQSNSLTLRSLSVEFTHSSKHSQSNSLTLWYTFCRIHSIFDTLSVEFTHFAIHSLSNLLTQYTCSLHMFCRKPPKEWIYLIEKVPTKI